MSDTNRTTIIWKLSYTFFCSWPITNTFIPTTFHYFRDHNDYGTFFLPYHTPKCIL
ncbi:unnamed protein product [Schistosoma mattheei]|uniref:Uncharacterized protein n=1 Tax=Schistosoma mattheei TaxID=31246 RepID=A0A183Q5W4_9TREM|nr:unnamed protein product [Schistosoma mattheei]